MKDFRVRIIAQKSLGNNLLSEVRPQAHRRRYILVFHNIIGIFVLMLCPPVSRTGVFADGVWWPDHWAMEIQQMWLLHKIGKTHHAHDTLLHTIGTHSLARNTPSPPMDKEHTLCVCPHCFFTKDSHCQS